MIDGTDTAAYTLRTLLDPLTSTNARRIYRFSESSLTYSTLFRTLEKVTGRRYHVGYLYFEAAQLEEEVAKQNGDVDAELAASHELIQRRQGTLLPLPWDHARFPSIVPSSLKDSLMAAFAFPKLRKAYGLD